VRRNEIASAVMRKISEVVPNGAKLVGEEKAILAQTGLYDIAEYSRAVHAEMEALLSCARIGVSTLGGTVYTTTFPCHNCAKHIVAAGINRVVFVEPYPKSFAINLHPDSIALPDGKDMPEDKVQFEPFVGVGPRRFMDLFSMHLGSGTRVIRKKNGKVIDWQPETAEVRVPLLPISYIEKETYLVAEIGETTKRLAKELKT
jgi:deoxycytidylate deaminase